MKDIKITLDTIIDNEKVLLSIGDSMVFASNTLSCIVGEAKSRKTFFRDLLVSKMFNNDEHFKGEFSGRCLIIDTEQSDFWVQRSLIRLHKLDVDVNDRVSMLAVKQFGPKQRLKIIEEYIQDESPEVVILDGIRDLLLDFNDIGESMTLINELMRLVNDYNIHICSILHVNPSSDKARGHLGTEVLNKCDAVLRVQTPGKGEGAMTTITSVVMRDKDIDPLKFMVIDGLPKLK